MHASVSSDAGRAGLEAALERADARQAALVRSNGHLVMATGERLIDDEELCALGSVAQTLIPILDPFLQEEGLELAGPEHSILALPLTQHGLLLLVDPAPR